MPEPPEERLWRIVEGLIAQTEAGQVVWETGSPPDSYAVTLGDVRFRVRSRDGDGHAPYILDLPGPELQTDAGDQTAHNAQLQRLHEVARQSAPDPFRVVEQQLGLIEPASGEGG
jgi:hypothetical protein